MMTAEELHKLLSAQWSALKEVYAHAARQELDPILRADTLMSIGELMGLLYEVMALIGRDIDDRGKARCR